MQSGSVKHISILAHEIVMVYRAKKYIYGFCLLDMLLQLEHMIVAYPKFKLNMV